MVSVDNSSPTFMAERITILPASLSIKSHMNQVALLFTMKWPGNWIASGCMHNHRHNLGG